MIVAEVLACRLLDLAHVTGLVHEHVVGDFQTVRRLQPAQDPGVPVVDLDGAAHRLPDAFGDVLGPALVGVALRLSGAGQEGHRGTRLGNTLAGRRTGGERKLRAVRILDRAVLVDREAKIRRVIEGLL
ncbi:hypothetical protein AB0B40_04880 [Streptomyces sp. NPDC042638]|uniref:hypothetical protein n=1 Tax=Streptomyces sp. NPDC042638 TaxID=3154333 RepID=UPI0033DE6348